LSLAPVRGHAAGGVQICIPGRYSEPMPRPTATAEDLPTSHTAIVGDVAGMWSKLRWDADLFRDLQLAWPDEQEPLAYAAINVCIAASSLRDWVKADLRRREPRADRPSPKDIVQEIWAAVPLQPMCEAIANSAKHSVLSDRWDGTAVLAWEEDEESPPGYVLRYSAADGSRPGNWRTGRPTCSPKD